MAGGSRDWEREQRRVAAEVERERRAAERARLAEEKERQRAKVEECKAEARRRTTEREDRVAGLRAVLPNGLRSSGRVEFDHLVRHAEIPPLDLGHLAKPIVAGTLIELPRPGAISRFFGGMRSYEQLQEAERQRHEAHVADVERKERSRQTRVAQLQQEHAKESRNLADEVQRYNEDVERLRHTVPTREKEAVEAFLGYVLTALPLPVYFPHETQVVFNRAAEHALVQLTLPSRDVVPAEKTFKYVERSNEERITARSPREIADIYRDTVAQIVVLALRNVLSSDTWLQRVGLNGHVHAIDPATGEWEYPCLVSVDVPRERFPREEALQQITAVECLRRRFKAIISNHPYTLEPIEPVLDFDLTKFAFVAGLDAVATLDSRPNLLEMSPTNFEHLVRQLFEAQGAEGWTTTQSNDDGVDAVILNRSNLVGGLAVVQAKRYRPDNVLGPNHYRELAGTMEEKKAGWGVLVTTSRFTPGCEQKARNHGRMQLIDGNKLVWMIREYLGKDVLIG